MNLAIKKKTTTTHSTLQYGVSLIAFLGFLLPVRASWYVKEVNSECRWGWEIIEFVLVL